MKADGKKLIEMVKKGMPDKEIEVAVYLGKNINTKDPPDMETEGNEVLVGGRTKDKEEGYWVSLTYEGNGKFVIKPLNDKTNIIQPWGTSEQIRRAVQRLESPDFTKIRPRRTKKDKITIKNFIDHKNSIELTITASPQDWQRLNQLLSENNEEFAKDFHHKFIRPVLYKEILPKKPRGRHRDANILLREIKYNSGELHQFFSYWCKKPREEWPNYLSRLIEIIGKAGQEIHIKRRNGKYGPKELTLYVMEEVYGKTAKKYGLKPFEDPNNFYIKYIYGSGILKYHKENFRNTFGKRYEDMPPEIIERIGLFIPPLEKILRILKII
jgi:hypothetical protein